MSMPTSAPPLHTYKTSRSNPQHKPLSTSDNLGAPPPISSFTNQSQVLASKFQSMESLQFFCCSLPCNRLNSISKPIAKDSNSRHSNQILYARARPIWNSGFLKQDGSYRLLGLRCCASHESANGLRDIFSPADEVSKVLIPSLPDELGSGGASPISSGFWEWKPKLSMHYEKSGMDNAKAPAVLFLPGFGVGSFHYEKQLKDLGREYRVWALDFLGQGLSLSSEDPAPSKSLMWGFGEESEPWAQELVYSVDLWKDQVDNFIEQVIGEPVYIAGNSLGGFVALYFAAYNPQLVKGVVLLNATPFWGFLPNPVRSPRLFKMFPWAGTFPLPASVRKITEIVWEKISDPSSIHEVLKQVYVDHSTMVDKVFSRIIETTQHPAAAASFASIMFAPRGELSFDEALSRCQVQDIPICLVYGKEDPWVKPIWGLRVKHQIPEAPYYEISPAGHCPHDEVPEVVNYLLRGWIKNVESQGSSMLPLLEEPESVQFGLDREVEFMKEGKRKSVQVRFLGSKFSIWNQIRSFFKSSLAAFQFSSR